MQPTNPNQFTEKAWEAIAHTPDVAKQHQQQHIESEHLMKAMLEQEGLASSVLTKAGINLQKVSDRTERFLQLQPKISSNSTSVYLGHSLDTLLDTADEYRQDFKDEFISIEHLLLAYAKDDRFGKHLLQEFRLDEGKLKNIVKQIRESHTVTVKNPEDKYQFLQIYGRDLTTAARQGQLDPVIGRDEEVRYLLQALSLRSEKIPLLIGEPGVGKTAIVEGLAQRIVWGDVPEFIRYCRLVTLDQSKLIIYAKSQTEIEYQLREFLREVINYSQGQIVLFIDDLHTIIGSDVINSNNLLRMMLCGQLRWISAITLDEYRKLVKKDANLRHKFHPIYVQEPTVEHTISILRSLKERYEVHHSIRIADSALVAAAELSQRHISDRFLPDKAIDLVDEAAALLKMEITSKPAELDIIDRRLMLLEMEKQLLAREDEGTAQTQEHLQLIEQEITSLTIKQQKLNDQWQCEKQLWKVIINLKNEENALWAQIMHAERNYDLDKATQLKYDKLEVVQHELRIKEAELLEIQSQGSTLVHIQVTKADIAKVVAKQTAIPMYA